MKKVLIIFLAVLLTAGCMSGCSAGTGGPAAKDGGISIVATVFPEYDWVMNILGENPGGADVTLLLDSGTDLHSYQPTAEDIMKISACDLFIYVGGESDKWVDDALQEATNKNMVVISLLDLLGDAAKEEEAVEGMQTEEEEEEADEAEEGPEYDEHVWLSLRCASRLVEQIAEAICGIDAANAAIYRSNAEAYVGKLAALDAEYGAAVAGAKVTTLLFADRFPFRYLTEDYGLSYYAAFIGCSAETEASFETVTFLSGKVDELGLETVLIIEGSDGKIADTVVRNTSSADQKILVMDSMQSVTAKDVRNGTTYLGIMEKNLSVLKEAIQ